MNIKFDARRLAGAAVVALAWGVGSSASAATTDIQVWVALNSHNADAFEDLVDGFNDHQNDAHVTLKQFDDEAAIEASIAGKLKQKDKKATPNLVQLTDPRNPDGSPGRSYVWPLHELLKKYPIKGVEWFLPKTRAFAHDTRGRLTGLPYMASVPVMFYDIDAFKKAGLKQPPENTWHGLQGQLLQLANKGRQDCQLVVGVPVSVDLESLASVNNQYYVSGDNGFKAKGSPKFNFDLLFIRHMSLMNSWVVSGIMAPPTPNTDAVARFTKRKCAMLISGSGNIGAFSDKWRLDYGVVSLPHYPDVTKKPGAAFVGGQALWATHGHSAAQDKATAAFVAWLAKPENATEWYQATGYLPLTKKAFDDTDAGYYKNLGDWRDIVASYAKSPSGTGRGFWVKNYQQVRAMLHEELNRTLSGKRPAVPTLKSATDKANTMSRGH